MAVVKALRATGSELLGLLVDDWTLFFGTVLSLGAAAVLAAVTAGDRAAVGVVLFAGVWCSLRLSLSRAVRDKRDSG